MSRLTQRQKFNRELRAMKKLKRNAEQCRRLKNGWEFKLGFLLQKKWTRLRTLAEGIRR